MSHLSFKNTIRLLHLWLGLISGLVVFVLGLTGSIYAFSDELKELCYKQRLYVDKVPQTPRLPLHQLVKIAEQALGKDRKISRAELSQKSDRTYMFRAMKLNRKAFGYWSYYVYYDKVYLNPYTGRIVYRENAKNEFFTIILALHMNLLLGDQVGHFIVRWSVVCFVILLTSGIILWWPKKRKIKQIKKSFSIKWKAKFKRLNYDLHNVVGFYAFLVLMLIAFTGLMWSFGLTTEKKSKLQSDTTQQLTKTRDDIILQQALKRSPETAYFLYNFPAAKSTTINLSAYQSNTSLYDRIQYRFDRYSGKLLEQSPEFKDLTITSKIIALNYDLHTGSAVGLPGKFIAFLSSLIAASLPVTGLLIWLNKKNR